MRWERDFSSLVGEGGEILGVFLGGGGGGRARCDGQRREGRRVSS